MGITLCLQRAEVMLTKNALNNYRMAGYLLLAIGLINLRYQWGTAHILSNSAIIFLPGIFLIAFTFTKSAQRVLAQKAVISLLSVVGIALVMWAVTN